MAENHVLIQGSPTMYPQNGVKDVNECSKNLVTGDFEKQFADRMMEKSGRRKTVIVLSVCVGALAVWMLVLTLVREVQIARLRRDLDDLTANMIAANANVRSLNNKLANSRLFNDFLIDDPNIYTDLEEDPHLGEKSESSVEKLHDLTVFDDDKMMTDDEDGYDDDDEDEEEVSGDFYSEYDKPERRAKVGTTTMSRLKEEDFMDTVIPFDDGNPKGKRLSNNIRELKRLLNENPENPNIGLPTSSPVKEPVDSSRSKRSVLPDAPTEVVEPYSPPRVVAKADERRKTKKFSHAVESTSTPLPVKKVSLTRIARSDEEGSHRRPFIAAHFHGNTSHLNTEIHEHYKGNGLVKLYHGSAHDVWYPSPWTLASPHPRPTLTRNGHVHVHHSGVYLVYVQIYYLDSHDIISWVLHRTNPQTEGRDTLLQCAQSSHSTDVLQKPNSCFSSAALFLKAGDKLAVRNTGGDRHSLMEPEKSFIGLIKLADADDPNDEEF